MQKSRKDYVRYPDRIDESEICFFCMDLCIDPIRCMGPCKSVSCRKCASKWCKNGRSSVSCPKKCVDPWRFELLPRRRVEMECPYSADCRIEYAEDLEKHLLECTHAPKEMQAVRALRKSYKCFNNHELKFFVGSFEEFISSVCQQCGQKGACRSKCPKCQLTYCVRCRAPPCSKECCPLGHPYRYSQQTPKTMICDICGMSAGLVGLAAYCDPKCNFDVCQLCFERLPESNAQDEVVRRVRQIVSNRCTKQHELTVMTQPHKDFCNMCLEEKVCWKECKTCDEMYCLVCKEIKLRQMECQFEHPFKLRPGPGPCMMCDQPEPQFCMVDKECNISLCEGCSERLSDISAQSYRVKGYLYCDRGHSINFYMNEVQRQKCASCNKERFLSLFCVECEPRKGYCAQCRPLDWKQTCYFGDQLKFIPVSGDTQPTRCAVCQELAQEGVRWCKYCKFKICQKCRLS